MTALDALISPTAERLQHAADNFTTTRNGPTRMQDAPIDRMLRAGQITPVQHQAAESLFADYYAAGLAPLGAVDYARVNVDGSKPSNLSDFRLGAADRYNRSMKELGSFFATAVDFVVLREQSAEAVGRFLGYNNASQARAVGLDRLRGGLDVLAVRYGLAKPPRPVPANDN